MTKLEEPVVIVGDIHGQMYDLCHMIEKAGSSNDTNYLFLGDYVDRGVLGLEVIMILLALKINFPTSVILLRGNHESRNMTENFTFRQEVINKYDIETYNLIMELFDTMPLSCIVDSKYFCMHGGISPDLSKVD